MNKSESIKELATALCKFQMEVKNPTNSAANPFFKSKYAPLNEILNDVRPLLTKHGLSILQMPAGDGDNLAITSLLMHESGEWIESCPLIMKPAKNDPQGMGSAITYGRRYGIAALLGISSEDDDDGNQATHGGKEPAKGKAENNSKGIRDTVQPSPQRANPAPTTPPSALITKEQNARLNIAVREQGLSREVVSAQVRTMGRASSTELLKSEAETLIAWVKAYKPEPVDQDWEDLGSFIMPEEG